MKLLSPSETKQNFKNKQANDIVQIGYMKKVEDDLQKRINTETAKFEEMLANQRNTYMAEKLSLQSEIKALEGILETKREEHRQLMIPVDTLRNEAEQLVKELNTKTEAIKEMEADLEDKIETLQMKLDRIAEREVKITEMEVYLIHKKVGTDDEAEKVSEGHKKLNDMIIEFNKQVELKTQELAMKDSAHQIEKKRVQEYLESREKEINEEKRGLADRRAALEREFNRINKK